MSNYTELLKGPIKPLGHFADESLYISSDADFFRYIAQYIVPLIRKSSHFEKFYFKWLKEKDEYSKLHSQLQANILLEVEQAFISLKLKLETNDFLKKPEVKEAIEDIARIIETKKPEGIPSYIYVAEERIRQLLYLLFDLGAVNIVADYAVIIPANGSSVNSETGKYEYFNKIISTFNFAPSIVELKEIENAYKNQITWVAWDFLTLVEWCWNTPFSFFNDKTLSFKDHKDTNLSEYWLMLHGYWVEINELKKANKSRNKIAPFFDKARFITYIKLILNEIILEQAINYEQDDKAESEIISPYSVAFRLDYNKLVLDVKWFEDIDHVTYMVHSFQEESGPHLFISQLLEIPIGQKANVPSDKVSGGSSVKYLENMKINGILRQLFFDKTRTKSVSMKTKSIKGSDLSKSDCENLRSFIKNNFREIPKI